MPLVCYAGTQPPNTLLLNLPNCITMFKTHWTNHFSVHVHVVNEKREDNGKTLLYEKAKKDEKQKLKQNKNRINKSRNDTINTKIK